MSIVGKPLNNYQPCIDACLRCFQACHECAVLCMQEPDVASRTNHIAMMMECAGICNEAACLMTMNSKHAKDFCMLCANVCKECSTGCAQFKDDHCQQCAAECEKCAMACMAM